MKTLILSFKEFYLFKEIADFFYEFTINKDKIVVNADSKMLEDLGY